MMFSLSALSFLFGFVMMIHMSLFWNMVDSWMITTPPTTTRSTPSSYRRKFTTTISSTERRNSPQEDHQSSSNNNADEKDLFEYFDPLLSPHAYPDGISPDHKPNPRPSTYEQDKMAASSPPPPRSITKNQGEEGKTKNTFGFEIPRTYSSSTAGGGTDGDLSPSTTTTTTTTTTNKEEEGKEPNDDLFDYFDPLLSPHAYPGGISPNIKPEQQQDDDRYNPLQFKTLPVDFSSSSSSSSSSQDDDTNTNNKNKNGTKDQSKKKLGILLMDHGSRNKKSNQRLEQLAQLYQLSLTMDNNNDDDNDDDNDTDNGIFVEAAHMEIVEPSIVQGLQKLLDQGVDEIICHPYFLSPGRHVREDIPQLVGEAIETLNIQIPIVTTEPLGSNTQLMIGTIHSLVQQAQVELSQMSTSSSDRSGN